MTEPNDKLLERMTLRELLALQAGIHDAIRAHIRAKNAQRLAASEPRPAGPSHLPQAEIGRLRSLEAHARTSRSGAFVAASKAPPGTGEQPLVGDDAFDLIRERDAWMARKRSTVR